jgi:hypothetical protein
MKRIAALFALILWSVSMTVSASASMAVLCVEKDGRASIEYSVDAHCDEVSKSVSPKAQSDALVHCADCVDRQLTSSAISSVRIVEGTAFIPVATYVVASLNMAPNSNQTQRLMPGAFAAPPDARSTYIGQRQTIVIQQ